MKRVKPPASGCRVWHSFQMMLLLRLSLVISIVILLMVLALNSMITQRMQKNQIALQRLKMENSLANLDYYFMNLMSKTDMLFFNQSLSNLLETSSDDLTTKIYISSEIGALTDSMFFNLKYPEVKTSYYFGAQVDVCLYVKNKDLYPDEDTIFTYDSVADEPFVTDLLNEERTFSWNCGKDTGAGRYLALNRRILSTKNMQDLAILQLRVPLSKIEAVLRQDLEENVDYYAYADTDDNVLSSEGPDDIFEEILSGEPYGTVTKLTGLKGSYIVDAVTSSLNGYRLITATSIVPIYQSVGYIRPLIYGTGLVAMLCCGMLIFLTSASMTRGIRQLIARTRQVSVAGHGGYAALKPIRASNEIMELDEAFRKMVCTIEDLYQRESQYQRNINEVKAELLQEQFNPHLLYNTLSMIRYVEQEQGQTSLYDVTDNLISFYKHVLNRGRLTTTVQDEVLMIRNYLRVVQRVYDIDLEVRINVDDDVLPFYSVKMFLQPIVENAVMHGLRQIGGGTLSITGTRRGEHIRFTISDDGVGIEPAVKDQIIAVIKGRNDKRQFESFGYISVSKRLKLFFGDQYTMDLHSEPGEGTTVTISIPALRENEIADYLVGTLI